MNAATNEVHSPEFGCQRITPRRCDEQLAYDALSSTPTRKDLCRGSGFDEESPSKVDLGYYRCGEETVPRKEDLGYGEGEETSPILPSAEELGYADNDAVPTTSPGGLGFAVRVKACQLRSTNTKRLSDLTLESYDNYDNSSVDDDDSSVDYDESSIDSSEGGGRQSSFVHYDVDDLDYGGSNRGTSQRICVGYDCLTPAESSQMPSRVNIDFDIGSSAKGPSRVTLEFEQISTNVLGERIQRRGSLEVSLATSRLPRRGTLDHVATNPGKPSSPLPSRPARRITLSHGQTVAASITRPTASSRRISMGHSDRTNARPTRRSTMDLLQSAPTDVPASSRRISIGHISRTNARPTRSSTMDLLQSAPTDVPSRATRRPTTRRSTMDLDHGAIKTNTAHQHGLFDV